MQSLNRKAKSQYLQNSSRHQAQWAIVLLLTWLGYSGYVLGGFILDAPVNFQCSNHIQTKQKEIL